MSEGNTQDRGSVLSVEDNSETKSNVNVGLDPSLAATKDAGSTKKASSTPLDQAYFTEGELLPWKGRWFRVRLIELNGERLIGLALVKETERAIKLGKRKERWLKQHPKSQQAAMNTLGNVLRSLREVSSAVA